MKTWLGGARAAGGLLGAAAAPALADTRTVAGDTMVLTTGIDETISIEPDASLSHAVRVTADNDCVQASGAGDQVSVNTDGCGDSSGAVLIAVPPGMPVVVNAHGDGNVRLGNTEGALVATLAGSGNFAAGRVRTAEIKIRGDADVTVEQIAGAASLEITGSGDMRIQRLQGPLQSSQRGSGNIAIGAIHAPAADITIQGSGDAVLGNGDIQFLRATVGGSGDLGVAAVVGSGEVHASGGSDVKLGQVTGHLVKDASGGSDIYVGAGFVSAGLGKLADLVSDPSNTDKIHIGSDGRDHGGNVGWHIFSAIVVLGLLFLLWRMVRRRGGVGALRYGGRSGASPAAATHPGVLAVRDTMQRLDGRLAKLEGYVTTREFELNRKFRELDTR